jgi:formate dehydrogenase subunit gamma
VLLLVSGLLLYMPEVKAVHLGGHRLVALLHVVIGFGFMAAVPLVFLLARNRQELVRDVTHALTPEPGDAAWLHYAGMAALGARVPEPPSGKFNAGQKLSTLCWICATTGLMVTGAVLGLHYLSKRFFDAAFVEQVFPWHTFLALASIPLLLGHLYLALVHPSTRPSLRGILTGRVDAAWAKRHHARWAAAPGSSPHPLETDRWPRWRKRE